MKKPVHGPPVTKIWNKPTIADMDECRKARDFFEVKAMLKLN